ncbi:hypothetical protein [Synechococcus sp. TAK9802]|uniref:hypothetical protein n=1 Tax=Synechococcus sp. TAK9802 TaxID=1442558 RepID=UPI0016454DF9|nr:hypothetical protein [Synechococcus sp. TAK9802]
MECNSLIIFTHKNPLSLGLSFMFRRQQESIFELLSPTQHPNYFDYFKSLDWDLDPYPIYLRNAIHLSLASLYYSSFYSSIGLSVFDIHDFSFIADLTESLGLISDSFGLALPSPSYRQRIFSSFTSARSLKDLSQFYTADIINSVSAKFSAIRGQLYS